MGLARRLTDLDNRVFGPPGEAAEPARRGLRAVRVGLLAGLLGFTAAAAAAAVGDRSFGNWPYAGFAAVLSLSVAEVWYATRGSPRR